jgi:hypothetical protein
VESDFLLVNWEEIDYRAALTDLSLEAISQCNQIEAAVGLVRVITANLLE